MGLLRLILALSVVSGHGSFFQPFFFINASAAVICFFTVSGFYMAYVINEKYKLVDQWQKKFLINRCLRLYPAYFFFLILYLIFQTYIGRPNFLTGLNVSVAHQALIALLNFSLVGQDIYAMVVEIKGIDPLHVMPIAQAWSIAVELELYVIAAFLFSTRFGLFTALFIGVVLRLSMQIVGLTFNPLGHMLVFNVLLFFALGGCAYILYKRIEAWPVSIRAAITGFFITTLLAYVWYHNGFWDIEARDNDDRCTLFYFGIALAIPFIFSLSKKNKLDNLLGHLSYPIYLCHIFLFDVAKYIGIKANTKYFVAVSLFVVSYTVYKWVEEPIQRFRAQLVQR